MVISPRQKRCISFAFCSSLALCRHMHYAILAVMRIFDDELMGSEYRDLITITDIVVLKCYVLGFEPI